MDWCEENILKLNIDQTKTLIVDWSAQLREPSGPASPTCRTLTSNDAERAQKITSDVSHPNNSLSTLLPSGRCCRLLRANTERMRSFFPQAIRLLNQTENVT